MALQNKRSRRDPPEGASLAESLLLALKTSIDTPAEQQPEYRVMLSALQRSAEKSDILKNVRTMVDKLQPQERAIITQNLAALEERLRMTTEFEDLQQEILDLKVAVTESADSQEMGERQEQGESQKPKGPEVWYNPSSWSPERQQQATDIAIVGGVVVGGALLLKWIFGKTAEKAHAAREKAGNVIHTVGNGIGKIRRGIMWSVGIGVTAVLGYFWHSGVPASQ